MTNNNEDGGQVPLEEWDNDTGSIIPEQLVDNVIKHKNKKGVRIKKKHKNPEPSQSR